MVNGNYVLYGDRSAPESEIVDDHVHKHTERKIKRKSHRTANELQQSLNQAQLDNDTDSVKYQKTIKEPRLLRYIPTTEVEENFVTEKFETYDLKPTEERPRRYAFTKKPKNPSDGSVNYAYSVYSRSSSNCSSPNANLPTISEHGEQYGTYRIQAMPAPTMSDIVGGYDTKLDKYFAKPRDIKPFTAKGTHPDSLYRIPGDDSSRTTKIVQVLRPLRWPIALIATCIALAAFVYFLMPNNTESSSSANGTNWETVVAGADFQKQIDQKTETPVFKDGSNKLGTKTSEIDFYNTEDDTNFDLTTGPDVVSATNFKRKLPVSPVFPTHLTPEVQYGNEKADLDRRYPKLLSDHNSADSTLKPHITQKPEKPLAIYFQDDDNLATATTETVFRTETNNNYTNNDEVQTNKNDHVFVVNTHPSIYQDYMEKPKEYISETDQDSFKIYEPNPNLAPEEHNNFNSGQFGNVQNWKDGSFTSGHSKFFGISMEDAEKMKSTTQSALYNTRVSPTLPTWRDKDDSTTKNYPNNVYSDVQCRSTRMAICRGVLPYDLASASAKLGDVEMTSLMPQIDYLLATNCSDRARHFMCALLEPECSPPPYSPKKPCYNLCKAVIDNCDGHIPRELAAALQCNQYSHENCVAAKSPCYARELQCGDGSCIPRDWICDGRNDCPAGEDEAKCTQCDETDFKCLSGGCIQKRWLCDGYRDCPEGEDESGSICGAQHVEAPADRHEPGEESAGSAPAPAVRRPNRISNGHRRRNDHPIRGEMDSSKELLVTSDSNNAVLRTFTPSPSRLKPYNHSRKSDEPAKERKSKELESSEENPSKSLYKNVPEHESGEDVNMGDLFDEFDNMEKSGKDRKKPSPPRPLFGVPPAPPKAKGSKKRTPPPTSETAESPDPVPVNQITKDSNNFHKVIDGAALLRRATAVDAAEEAAAKREDALEGNNTNIDNEDLPPGGEYGAGKQGWGRAHTSPCPSGELRCVDGLCITLAQLCDGTIDCTDHADEDNCYT